MDFRKLGDTTLKYLLKSKLDFTMFDVAKFLNERIPTLDVFNMTKKYIYVSNSDNIKKLLIEYLNEQLNQTDIEELDMLTIEDLDMYFDITEKEDDIIIIEQAIIS